MLRVAPHWTASLPHAGPALAHGRIGRAADAAARPEQPPIRAEPDEQRALGQRGLLALILHRARTGPGPAHQAPASLHARAVPGLAGGLPPAGHPVQGPLDRGEPGGAGPARPEQNHPPRPGAKPDSLGGVGACNDPSQVHEEISACLA